MIWRKQKRERVELYLAILKTIRHERHASPTRIVYRSNLSFTMYKTLIDSLLRNGLVKSFENDGRKIYKLTDEGLRAMETLEEANKIISKLRRTENSMLKN